MSTKKFDGTDDILDSREILERIEELIEEFEDATEYVKEGIYFRGSVMSVDDWAFGLTQDDAEELAALIEFRDENDSAYSDSFADGITFIHDDFFVEAMEEICNDFGFVPQDMDDLVVIDWKKTADNLRVDYEGVTFRGSTYWAG